MHIRNYKNIIQWVFFGLLLSTCKDKYDVILPPSQVSLLVVEGTILTNSQTIIKLSRTSELGKRNIHFEEDASVVIEASDNSYYPLVDKDSGRYESSFSTLNEDVQYRVRIKTKDNREYLSEFVDPVKSPEIDSITWTRYKGGVEIYVNAHDDQYNTQYFRWELDEVWEIFSKYPQYVMVRFSNVPSRGLVGEAFLYDSATGKYNDTIRRCWNTRFSSNILVGGTFKLSGNRVYMPIKYLPEQARELDRLYSINVRQYGLSKEGYDFFQIMKKNSESLGTIFDRLPSEIHGNVYCLSDTAEKTVGYVGAGRVYEKRLFISRDQLPDWKYYNQQCEGLTVANVSDSLVKYLYYFRYETTFPLYDDDGNLIAVSASSDSCVDCRLWGSNIKPPFWPN